MRKLLSIAVIVAFVAGCQTTSKPDASLTPDELKARLASEISNPPADDVCFQNQHGVNTCALAMRLAAQVNAKGPQQRGGILTAEGLIPDLNTLTMVMTLDFDQAELAEWLKDQDTTSEAFGEQMHATFNSKAICEKVGGGIFSEYGGKSKYQLNLNDGTGFIAGDISSC